jgi:rSAM-partnered protein
MTEGRESRPDDEGTGRVDGAVSAATGSERRFERHGEPRADRTREWELFVRESSDESLRHAGSVSAPTAEIAREQATTLFGFAAETLWLCPADETVRLVADDVALGDRAADDEEPTDGAGGADGAETADGDGRAEP